MNTWLTVIGLAVLQGIAEFLPVSSSGHLALLSNLSGIPQEDGATFSIVLHAGSLLAIITFTSGQFWDSSKKISGTYC